MSRMCLFFFSFFLIFIFLAFAFSLCSFHLHCRHLVDIQYNVSTSEGQISEPLQCPSLLLWVVFMSYFPAVYVTCDNKPIWVLSLRTCDWLRALAHLLCDVIITTWRSKHGDLADRWWSTWHASGRKFDFKMHCKHDEKYVNVKRKAWRF